MSRLGSKQNPRLVQAVVGVCNWFGCKKEHVGHPLLGYDPMAKTWEKSFYCQEHKDYWMQRGWKEFKP